MLHHLSHVWDLSLTQHGHWYEGLQNVTSEWHSARLLLMKSLENTGSSDLGSKHLNIKLTKVGLCHNCDKPMKYLSLIDQVVKLLSNFDQISRNDQPWNFSVNCIC